MTPFYYQQQGIDEIVAKFETCDRVLYQLATSGGKTAIFSFLCKWWIENHDTNVVILAHRTELIEQAEATLGAIGIGSEPLTAGVKRLKHHSRVYISMVETANNRLKRNAYTFNNVGLVIVDECHILVFHKLFDFFPRAKILGCTATPCVFKRVTFYKCPFCKATFDSQEECCDTETQEWSRPFTLSQIYQDIVVGPSIKELIEFGSVVQEISFIKHYSDDSKLRTDSDGEFTSESVDEAYNNDEAVFNVLLNYKKLCQGKKTIIYNSSSKANLIVYQKFIDAGITNIRMFDSVNKVESGKRRELLKWFDETPDAILCNVGVFTTGFDSREVQAIILNRPTGSLSLFIQIAGRGARSSKKIYKDNFIFIDGGGNIERFGEWSQDRDWRAIFFKGVGKEKAKVMNAMDIQDCTECGALFPKAASVCPECGNEEEKAVKPLREKQESEDVLSPIREIPPPKAEKIYNYTVSQGEDLNFAWRILINYVTDMFKYYRVTLDAYERSKQTGEFERKVLKLITPSYFTLKGKDDLTSGIQRTRKYFVEQVRKKLDARYYA
jgi:superfamily II DNA or RNA helicase